jgi:hypothetical protein
VKRAPPWVNSQKNPSPERALKGLGNFVDGEPRALLADSLCPGLIICLAFSPVESAFIATAVKHVVQGDRNTLRELAK